MKSAEPKAICDKLAAKSFQEVLQDELAEIAKSRNVRQSDKAPLSEAWNANLVGLAFSGGGIRSATFNLGVLQALAICKFLPMVDYLSLVSGGGYIGSWFACWCKRAGGVGKIQDLLTKSVREQPNQDGLHPIRFLREYSNYLTPKSGFFSADTWTSIAVWHRNTFLNQMVLIGALASLLLFVRMIGQVFDNQFACLLHISETQEAIIDVGVAALALITATVACGFHLRWFRDEKRSDIQSVHPRGQIRVILLVVLPLLVTAFTGNKAIQLSLGTPDFRHWAHPTWLDLNDAGVMAWLASLVCGTFFAVLLILLAIVGKYPSTYYTPREWPSYTFQERCTSIYGIVAASIGAGVFGAVLIRIYCGFLTDWARHDYGEINHKGAWLTLTLGTPITIFVFSMTKVVQLGLMGSNFPDERREWWARLGAWLVLAGAVWMAVFCAAVYAPLFVAGLNTWIGGPGLLWIGTTCKGILAARSPQTGKAADSDGKKSSPLSEVLSVAFPYIFVVGLLIAISAGLQWSICRLNQGIWLPFEQMNADYWRYFTLPWAWLIGSFIVTLSVTLIFGRRVDINEFSLHHFYKNRLVRCYLGASRPYGVRRPNPFTGFDPFDDPKLARFRVQDCISTKHIDPQSDLVDKNGTGKSYIGPYPILNTALNLASGDDLAWQERMAESFIFTPLYCGFNVAQLPLGAAKSSSLVKLADAGYRPTECFGYGEDRGPAIGTAMAISGAATNPNMGYHTSPATAVLMTFFNARLGWWIGNPRAEDYWTKSSPKSGVAYLLNELLRFTTDQRAFVNLSDGGHFENLGIYELVRRKCRFVIACDAEEDHEFKFGGLASAIRKCRSDFGVEIDIDVSPLRPTKSRPYSSTHFQWGTIDYPHLNGQPQRGYLLYIKSSLIKDNSTDVREYADRAPGFPHQSTGDQWFDESQFESYRKLGFDAARSAFASRFAAMCKPSSRKQLFHDLSKKWAPESINDSVPLR